MKKPGKISLDQNSGRNLRYETLEDRRVLAVATVTTPLDVVDFNDGVTSLREAIFATNTVPGPDEIVFDFGHDGPETILLTQGELRITDDLTITGPGADLLTIDASGNDPTPEENNDDGSRVFNIIDTDIPDTSLLMNVELFGLRLTGGDSDSFGGAIASEANLTLNQMVIANNAADSGGALSVSLGETQIIASELTRNTARRGGAIHSNGDLTISQSEVSNNSAAWYGGGIVLNNGTLTIKQESLISNNSSVREGGGIYSDRSDSEVTILDSTISGNSAVQRGGGVFIGHGVLTVSGSTISDNSTTGDSAVGGGIALRYTESLIEDSVISNNSTHGSSAPGGGIYSRSPITITASQIIGNSTNGDFSPGGGVFVSVLGGTSTLTDVTIHGNSSTGPGGGVYNSTFTLRIVAAMVAPAPTESEVFSGQIAIYDSTISDNHSESIGGGWFIGGNRDALLSNSTISSNTANDSGGGVYSSSPASARFQHATIAYNRSNVDGISNDSGGGVFLSQGTLELDHTIVARNSAFLSVGSDLSGLLGAVITPRYSLIGNNSVSGLTEAPVGSPDAHGNLIGGSGSRQDINPRLGPLQDNGGPTMTHALLPDSPAINAGDPEFTPPPETDQRGLPFERVSDGRIDIGAFEFGAVPPITEPAQEYAGGWGDANGDGLITGLDFLAWQRGTPTNLDGNDKVAPNDQREPEGDVAAEPPATVIVTTFQDEVDIDDNRISLREAIFATNTVIGPNEIVFGFGGSQTILLTLGQLQITDDLTIIGPGAELLAIDASGNDPTPNSTFEDEDSTNDGDGSNVFVVDDDDSQNSIIVSLEGMTLTGADSSAGGAILSREKLTLIGMHITENHGNEGGGVTAEGSLRGDESLLIQHTLIDGNSSSADGGAIFAFATDTVIEYSHVENNSTPNGRGAGVYAVDSQLTVSHSEIAHNTARRRGGGIYVHDSDVNIDESQVFGNSTLDSHGSGGGIYAEDGDLRLHHSELANNSTFGDAAHGGGLYFLDRARGELSIEHSEVRGNQTHGPNANGGGINFVGDRFSLSNTSIEANATRGAGSHGGGIIAFTNVSSISSLLVLDSSIRNNVAAGNGGGVYTASPFFGGPLIVEAEPAAEEPVGSNYLQIRGTTIAGNRANGDGGGWYSDDDASVLVSNSTINNNNAHGSGGGVFVIGTGAAHIQHATITRNASGQNFEGDGSGGGLFVQRGSLHLDHSIVAGNRDNTQFGPDFTGFFGANVELSYSLIGTNLGTGLTAAPVGSPDADGNIIGGTGSDAIDPQLGGLRDNGGATPTLLLRPNSPAINAGDPDFTPPPASDQRGSPFLRVSGGRIDIGAFEVQPHPGDFDGDNDADGADLAMWEENYLNGANGADANEDGLTTGIDFLKWQLSTANIDPPPPTLPPQREPEPLLIVDPNPPVVVAVAPTLTAPVVDSTNAQASAAALPSRSESQVAPPLPRPTLASAQSIGSSVTERLRLWDQAFTERLFGEVGDEDSSVELRLDNSLVAIDVEADAWEAEDYKRFFLSLSRYGTPDMSGEDAGDSQDSDQIVQQSLDLAFASL